MEGSSVDAALDREDVDEETEGPDDLLAAEDESAEDDRARPPGVRREIQGYQREINGRFKGEQREIGSSRTCS